MVEYICVTDCYGLGEGCTIETINPPKRWRCGDGRFIKVRLSPSTDSNPGDQGNKSVPMSRKRRNGNKITGA